MNNQQVNLMPKEAKIRQNFTFTVRDAETGEIKRITKYHNLVVTVGRSVIAQRLAGDNTNSLNVDFGELGSGVTAPANGDTTLETPTIRKATASATSASNKAFLSYFFLAAEAIGTHKEFGTFIDGTSTIGTGILLSRVTINITKSGTETLTIDVEYTVT